MIAILALILLFPGSVGAQATPVSTGEARGPIRPDDPPVEFAPGRFTPAQACGACHRDTYAVWKENAVHANSLDVPFMEAYREAVARSGAKSGAGCLTCHAPTTVLSGDYELKEPVTREGITCDFCHSLKAVRLRTPENPFDLDVGPVKRGPLHRPEPTVHQAVKSDLFASSALCGGCHEYANPNGVNLLTTYSEWEAGPFAGEGVTCQTCHMPLFRAELVRNQTGRRLDRIFTNLHRFPGGRSGEQLSRAVRADLTGIQRRDDGTRVAVEVRNDGAGHRVPTGLASRRLVLELTATPLGGAPIRMERVYRKSVRNASGQEILEDGASFLEAASLGEDTRIGIRESRTEIFDLPIPRSREANLRIRLSYGTSAKDPGRRLEKEIAVIDTALARE